MVRLLTRDDLERTAWRLLASPDSLSIWDWQVKYGRVPASESGRPSRWLPERSRLMEVPLSICFARLTGRRDPDDPYAHEASEVGICGASQISKTKGFLHPIVSWTLDVMPGNFAFISHRQKNLKKSNKVRLQPMLEATPRLRRLLPVTEQRRRENLTAELWHLGASNMHLISGAVAADLREYALQLGVGDEIEAWPINVEGEGDPVEIYKDRQKTYRSNSLFGWATTPNDVRGHGWRRCCAGSHERLCVECPDCGGVQDLDPDQLRILRRPGAGTDPTPDQIEREDLALWACRWCATVHDSAAKEAMIRQALRRRLYLPGVWLQDEANPGGRWLIAHVHGADDAPVPLPDVLTDLGRLVTRPAVRAAARTFQYNYLYDRECSLGRFLAHELRAGRGSAEVWHSHRTGWRAEPVLDAGVAVSADDILAATVADYRLGASPFPARWLIVTADQQGNRASDLWFAYAVRAVAEDGSTWLIDTGRADGLSGLREVETRSYQVAGVALSPCRVAIDGANGNVAKELRAWAAEPYVRARKEGADHQTALKRNPRVLLVGTDRLDESAPWAEWKPTAATRVHLPDGCRIFRFAAQAYRDRLHRRMAGDTDQPPWKLPRPADDDKRLARHLQSLTSEALVMDKVRGPDGRQRDAMVWRPARITRPDGTTGFRTDTHWLAAEMLGLVLADLMGIGKRKKKPTAEGATPAPKIPSAPADERRGHSTYRRPLSQRRLRLHHRRG